MTIRVTVGSASAASLAGLQAASSSLAALQQQLSTGNQISAPSDDPAGTVRALELRSDLKRNAQYARNASDATAWLSAADTAYGQITDLVQKARTLVVQASNTGASTGQSAGSIADQLAALKQAILKLANTTYNNRPIFGGTTAGAVAFAQDPVTGVVGYQGDPGTVSRAIGDQNTVQISQTGTQAFGADGSNLFDLMDKLVANLRGSGTPTGATAPPDANTLTDPLGTIDAALGNLTSARAASGAALSRVQAAQTTQATDQVTIKSNLSSIQDIDLADVAVRVNTAQVVYQAALQTTANVRQLSLLNFLR